MGSLGRTAASFLWGAWQILVLWLVGNFYIVFPTAMATATGRAAIEGRDFPDHALAWGITGLILLLAEIAVLFMAVKIVLANRARVRLPA